MGAIWVLVMILAYKAGERLDAYRAGGIRRNVYPDPVCETCGKPLDGREAVCVPEG